MAVIPYMPFYIADYLADAAHLSTIEHGAYMLLIMAYWQRGKPLPSSDDRLANIARMTEAQWGASKQAIADFFVESDGTWSHKRIDAELSKFRDKSEKSKAAGVASGQRRLNVRSTNVQQMPNGRSTDAQRTLNHTDTDTDTDTKETNTPLPPEAEIIEAAWDRHKCYSRQEGYEHVVRMLLSKKIDWPKFSARHGPWCEYWSKKGWNAFGSLTLLGWIQANMPLPPDEAVGALTRNEMTNKALEEWANS